jgi:Tyrosine phosphatase family
MADYLLTTERIDAIIDRLLGTRAYASNLRERPRDSHVPRAEGMQDVFGYVDAAGGTERWLRGHGWRPDDTDALREKLVS